MFFVRPRTNSVYGCLTIWTTAKFNTRHGYNPAIGYMFMFRAPPHECCFVNISKIYDMFKLRLQHGDMSRGSLRLNNIHCTGRAHLCVFRAPAHKSGGYHWLHVRVSCATALIRYTNILQFKLQHYSKHGRVTVRQLVAMCVFRAPPHECYFVNSSKIYDMLNLNYNTAICQLDLYYSIINTTPVRPTCVCFVHPRTKAKTTISCV